MATIFSAHEILYFDDLGWYLKIISAHAVFLTFNISEIINHVLFQTENVRSK